MITAPRDGMLNDPWTRPRRQPARTFAFLFIPHLHGQKSTGVADVEAMDVIDASNDPERAEQSCASCKRLKRRCSKDLPTCLLCSRVGRRCDYSIGPVTPTRSDPDSSTTARLQTRSGTPSSFLFRSDVLPNPFAPTPPRGTSNLATCFLDSVAMRGADAALPCDLIWRDVCSGLGEVSADEATSITDRYFKTTHSWLPIGMFDCHSRKL